jgi:pimeloyl-[acyl-carrier protein] methyl ester esterase
MQIARQHCDMVQALVLVASTPRFSRTDDWLHAMSPAVLDSFAGQLAGDYKSTLQRFLALQVKGSDDARQVLRELRDRVLDNANVDLTALQSGLAILKQADLRAALTNLEQLPCLLIYGERDMLVPLEALPDIQALLANCQTWVVKGAGHAPFISHPVTFIKQLNAFLHETG